MILNPNCSEAVYKIKSETFKKFTSKQVNIFDNIIESMCNTLKFEIPIYIEGQDFEYRPYFEKIIIDLFLDYFNIQAERTHWTGSGTTYMKKEVYEKEMKAFCEHYDLPYKKDSFERRFIDK